MVLTSSITMPSMVGLGLHALPEGDGKKVDFLAYTSI